MPFGPKKKSDRSRWFITINSNQADERYIAYLEEAMEYLHKHINNYLIMRDRELGVDDVIFDAASEMGKVHGFAHVHAFIDITHRNNIRLNYPKIKKLFCDASGLENCHFDAQLIKKSEAEIMNEGILEYISKTSNLR